MGALTNAIHAAALDYLFGGTGYTGTVKVRLTTTAPTQTTPGTEVSTGDVTNYARLSLTNNATNFPAASVANPSVKSNGVALEWLALVVVPASVTLRGIELWDSADSVRMGWAALSDIIIQNGNDFTIAIGDLDITVAPA